MAWDGDDYQARFDRLAAKGVAMHGEVDFVVAYAPATVLDAGCGTGRVAIELSRRGVERRGVETGGVQMGGVQVGGVEAGGVEVVGVDVDASMLATAAQRAPHLTWVHSDLTMLDLGRVFDVVVMAGNVPLFTPPGTQGALVAGVGRHVGERGVLVAGFGLGRGYSVEEYDEHAGAVGLVLAERWSTWDRAPFTADSDYAVSVHRRGSGSRPAGQ